MITKRLIHIHALLMLILCGACSASLQLRTAQANAQLSASAVRLKNFVQAQYDTKQMSEEDYRVWRNRLGTAAKIGQALTTALIKGDSATAAVQISAFIDLIDQLFDEQVIKLSASQQMLATITLEVARTTLLVMSVAVGR